MSRFLGMSFLMKTFFPLLSCTQMLVPSSRLFFYLLTLGVYQYMILWLMCLLTRHLQAKVWLKMMQEQDQVTDISCALSRAQTPAWIRLLLLTLLILARTLTAICLPLRPCSLRQHQSPANLSWSRRRQWCAAINTCRAKGGNLGRSCDGMCPASAHSGVRRCRRISTR